MATAYTYTSTQALILTFLNNVREDLITDLKAKNISNGDLGMVATAQGGDDFTNASGALTGNHYYWYLVHGRKPGKRPPISAIQAWLIKKGITLNAQKRERQKGQKKGEKEGGSPASMIARKIGNVGTDIYLGKRPPMALWDIIDANKSALGFHIGHYFLNRYTKIFSDIIKTIP